MGSDEELMAALARGDEGALGRLMERHGALLHGLLVRLLGDGAAAEDLFQETWIRIVRAAPRFDPRRRFRPWAVRIATNLARDEHRRRRLRLGGGHRPAEEERAPEGGDPAEAGELRERLRALPPHLREPLVLRYFGGLDEGEIAAALDIPRGTVKSRLHHAVKRLRAAYREDGR